MSRSSDTALQGVLADTGETAKVVVDATRVSLFDRSGDRIQRRTQIAEQSVGTADSVV
jgi:hypothetical protein